MTNSPDTYERIDDEESFDLGAVLSALRRRWLLIAAITITFTATAFLFAAMLPNYYVASALVQIDKRDKKIAPIVGVLSDLKADTPSLQSEVQVIASKAIAARVIARLGLRKDPEFSSDSLVADTERDNRHVMQPNDNSKGLSASGAALSLSKQGQDQPQTVQSDPVVERFLGNLRVERVLNSLTIRVSFVSRDPAKAARIANAIVDVYIERQYEEKSNATRIAANLIEKRLVGLREKLAASERKIESFKTANGIYASSGQALIDRRLTSQMEALVRAKNHTANARSRYIKARQLTTEKGDSTDISEVLQNGTIRLLRTGLANALRKHAELATKYGPRHPRLRSANADVAKARAVLKEESQKILKTLKIEYQVALDREQQLRQQLEDLKSKVSTTKSHRWALLQLQREAKANHQLYVTLLSRKKQTEQTLGMHFADAKVITPAVTPLNASYPKRSRMVLTAFAAGLILSIGLVVILDQMSGGVSDSSRIEREFAIPYLASLPKLRQRGDGLLSPLRAMRLMIGAPNSRYARSMRELRYELDRNRNPDASRLVLITSAISHEGKTLIASNLAHQLVLTGTRTLLIDADMNKSMLSAALGARSACGLFEVLCKGQPIDHAILKDQSTGLHFMPAAGPNSIGTPPAEILTSRRAKQVLQRLKQHYDTIVIDAPALLPVIDARILANYADQVVLTINWQSTPKHVVHRALRTISAEVRKRLGIVLNGAETPDFAEQSNYQNDNSLLESAA